MTFQIKLYRIRHFGMMWDDEYMYACNKKGMRLIMADDEIEALMRELRSEITQYLRDMSKEQEWI